MTMKEDPLYQQLDYDKAYRENRLQAAHWVLAHLDTMPRLLEYCFRDDSRLSYKALWVLEFVCREDLSALYPHLDYFFEHLHKAKLDQAVRPVAMICELLTLAYYKKKDANLQPLFTQRHKEAMTECCFDWMITEQKVACQARAMTSLYLLGTEFEWIHPELKPIIETNIHSGSAGYKARGKSILQQIDSFKG